MDGITITQNYIDLFFQNRYNISVRFDMFDWA